MADSMRNAAVGADGSTDSQLAHWRQMQDYYKSIYDSQVSANNSAAADATAQMLSVIDTQIRTINEEYRNSDLRLYRDYMESKKNLPQQLAAAGYSGGLSESGHIALDTGYQEALNQNQRVRISAQSALRAQGEEQRSRNEAKAAAANADARREYYGYLASLEQTEYAALQKRAAELSKGGDFSHYEAIGYSADEVAQLRAAWEAEHPELAAAVRVRSGGYSAGEVAKLPPVTAQQVLKAMGYLSKVSGKWDAATEKAYKAAFGKSSGNYKTAARSYSAAAASGKPDAGSTEKKPASKGGVLVAI